MRFYPTHVRRKARLINPEDEPFWRDPGQFGPRNPDDRIDTAHEIMEVDRLPSFTPIGLLGSSGTPLGRFVIPIKRSIGFGCLHPDDTGETDIAYITTEASIRMSETEAAQDYDDE